jgi:hypothetical protein
MAGRERDWDGELLLPVIASEHVTVADDADDSRVPAAANAVGTRSPPPSSPPHRHRGDSSACYWCSVILWYYMMGGSHDDAIYCFAGVFHGDT